MSAGGAEFALFCSIGDIYVVYMSTTIPWRQVYDSMLASPTFIVSGSGASITPRFGDYLDTIAGEVDVFMTIGDDPYLMQTYRTCQNDPVTFISTYTGSFNISSGSLVFKNTGGGTITLTINPLPPPGPDSDFQDTGEAVIEP
jgi:hypothetical protein